MDAHRWTPQSGDEVDELREMRALGQLLQRSVEVDAIYEGSDSSGFVTVLVNGRGAVQDVVIDSGWVNGLGPTALGPALLQAFQAANIAALSASLENFRSAVDSGGVAKRTAEVAEEEATPWREKSYEELVERVERANRSLERTVARVAEFQRLTSVSGTARLLRISLDHGSITGVSVTDPRRATQMPPSLLADEALSMFQAAAPPST
jgi:DNA-binding protein YbaB